MLEGLVAWVINNYLGKYVENLNTDQLSIAVLQGAVELENLPLKKDALRQVGLPIQVRAGHIGKVKLKIPVSQITSAPWEIYMEQLYLVAGPLRLSELDEEAEEQALLDYKLGMLDFIEACWRAETETTQDSYYASSYSSWLGLSMNFAANIIENLQLKIKDVHFRFEDDVTVNGKVFASGVQIDSLTAQSCDEMWNPCFISSSSQESFKLIEMSGFSVYWDNITREDLWGDLTLPELSAAMKKKAKHDYLLSPVNAQAQIKRNRSELPLRSRVNPRIVCNLTLDEVPLSLTDWQYDEMVGCKRGLRSIQRRHGHLRSRPKCAVKENPMAWWVYAMRRLVKPQPTWESTCQKAKENVEYVAMYTKLLTNPSAPLHPDTKAFKDKVEWERSFEELRILREVAMGRTRPPKPVKPLDEQNGAGVGVLASWFPQWWGQRATQPSPVLQGSVAESSMVLEEKILDALADTVENNTILKRDTVFGQFNFTLRQGNFNLCNSDRDPLMELQFQNVKVGLESRPRTASHSFEITLGAIYLRDHLFKDSAFPVLISPQSKSFMSGSESAPSARPSRSLPPGLAKLLGSSSAASTTQSNKEQPLFQLNYEYKPFNSSAERKLEVRSKSLDIVYNPGATKWIVDFFTAPHQSKESGLRQAARQGYHAMKRKTKQQLLNNWDYIIYGQTATRKGWEVELDISAPQIFLVEHFNDKNAILCVVDFGKLRFSNRQMDPHRFVSQNSTEVEEEEDEEAFQTPCSTPPGSEASSTTASRKQSTIDLNNLNELLLHNKLYERYTIELSDLQILVGCVRDNWKYAHLKGTSSLHILDKFNISLQMERRVVHTIDPQYPSLTLTGNLPKLVAHINEDKVTAIRTLVDVISGKGLISPLRSQDTTPTEDFIDGAMAESVSQLEEDDVDMGARLFMLQFSIDQMALEVQSRGRSVAELQVTGVKLSFTKRPFDTSLSLSVHGLLLVDALQTFGPDFELLVASHKHVGMDTLSGSLQDSEPTSPTSPASPEPESARLPAKIPTSPISISQALNSLSSSIGNRAKSPAPGRVPSPPPIKALPISNDLLDTEALISVEFVFVSADCPTNEGKNEHLQIANIQFNNLDIIANQETIVELVGFVHRVFPKQNSLHVPPPQQPVDDTDNGECPSRKSSASSTSLVTTRTQLTFDFHRLNVLLLRAIVKESGIVGRKIATATMTEAKIHASIGLSLEVEGSLGGLQVLDMTPEGQTHQRILSLGDDPLADASKSSYILACLSAEMYNMAGQEKIRLAQNQAFSFNVKRESVTPDTDTAKISIRMASVWYVHSPHMLMELRSCAVEFKQYLSNLFASIKNAATEMAIGIVHARAEALAQSLSMGGRLYGSSSDISQTPRKRRSLSCSNDHLESTRGTTTPRSPTETNWNTHIKWDIVLATPVVVLPRKSSSTQCVVSHLGSITVKNADISPASSPWDVNPNIVQKYIVNISAINLYTIDISKRLTHPFLSSSALGEASLMRAEELYGSKNDGAPVLHNTSVQLYVIRELNHSKFRLQEDILMESMGESSIMDHQETLTIKGSVVNPIKFSLTRSQYEQLLQTVDTLLMEGKSTEEKKVEDRSVLENILEDSELNTGVSTLSMDPALRARMMSHSSGHRLTASSPNQSISLTVGFELPLLTLELLADLGAGEQKFVELSFKELIVQYEKSHNLETIVQISLHSVMMEDLQKPEDSKHRLIMLSSNANLGDPLMNMPGFVSKSCPNLNISQGALLPWHSSLPDHLETGTVLGAGKMRHHHVVAAENSMENRMKGAIPRCPYTPPPSPRGKASPSVYNEDNLVHVNICLKPSRHPNINSSRSVTVDFNSLDVIVNVESWVVVLDFFGISDIDDVTKSSEQFQEPQTPTSVKNITDAVAGLDSELDITVKSFSLLLNRKEYEVARAVMSNFSAHLTTKGGSDTTQTEASIDSFVLCDFTPIHSLLYKERFVTAGLQLSMNKFNSPDVYRIRPYDFKLKLNMTSLVYVHSQRYVAEIQTFFNLFPHLRREVGYFRGNLLEDDENTLSTRVLLEIRAPSPIIILPMSSQTSSVIVANLGNLTVRNAIKMSDSPDVISRSSDPRKEVLLDVMKIELESMDLATGIRVSNLASDISDAIPVGSYLIKRSGPSLLREKCHLSLQVERNLMRLNHCVPDLSIHGKLSTLAASLTLENYKLISGLLTFNIGECIDDLQMIVSIPDTSTVIDDDACVWTNTYMNFDLQDVSVCLVTGEFELACINFIKSSLTVDNFSNRTQDIDLVSQEILITDIRYQDQPANKRSNVFTNILQPIHQINDADSVQAQIHHRRNIDSSKFTILLNNMRLMAILDWWELVRDFIMTKPDVVPKFVHVSTPTSQQPSIKEQTEIPYELKLNITDSEIVVVQDTSQWDTNAVILKSTTVITYRPLEIQKPVSCNLNHCEMFSCILGLEDETALSIIDPVTVNMEITRRQLADGSIVKVLKVHMAHLSLRLSYHDFCMFMQMLNSLPKQTQAAKTSVEEIHPANFRSQLEKLRALDFKLEDCADALNRCNGQLDEAALWLTQNAIPLSCSTSPNESPVRHIMDAPFSFNNVEVETDSVCLCVIDDCRDADVPLVEFLFNQLELKQNLEKSSGLAQATISVHYYNRHLSGWEPFIEPWSCNVIWDQTIGSRVSTTGRDIAISSKEALNINITSSLVELYKSVKEIWTQDYYTPKENIAAKNTGDLKSLSSPPGYRRRSPFVPFALKNDTGCRLYFSTIVSHENNLMERKKVPDSEMVWTAVDPKTTVPFSFHERGKVRHRDSHKLRSHQLGVRVEGWQPIIPVTVDRVGVYFRQAFPELKTYGELMSQAMDLPQARVVLEVTLEGSARKLVTVRSALQISNQLDHPVEIKLTHSEQQNKLPMHLMVRDSEILSVPLSHAMGQMWARPSIPMNNSKGNGYPWPNKAIGWQQVDHPGQVFHETRLCGNKKDDAFRFCAAIHRENYPADRHPPLTPPLSYSMVQPAHTITLLPPLTIVNLLPYELCYSIKDKVKNVVKPGQQHSDYTVDLESLQEISMNLENFTVAGTLFIPSCSGSFASRIKLHDQEKRRLHLNVTVNAQPGTFCKITVYAPFWLVNKTAIPLVFRQEGVSSDTAGQYEEHEVARMVAPLLFSFSDNDSSPTVTARVGMKVHGDGVPMFCRSFTLQPGVVVRRLNVCLRDNRPDLVYVIGIEVRKGRGRYNVTNIVTLSAHYQIHNKSSYKLQFAQKCFATTVNDPGAQQTYLTAVPNCSLPFHWPRLDKDQLLCVKILDISHCFWSGGFKIDSNSSLHLNIRDLFGKMYFLRIEIVLQGATYFIVLSDADTMPPPIRIDNFSHVPIQFHQVGLQNLVTSVKAQSCLPYALDEPILQNQLTVIAPGGVSAHYDLNNLVEGPGLTYENFIYIAFTGTFKHIEENVDMLDVESQQLVLDVPDLSTGKVVLARKQQGARSQLWRMTADGCLQHEGSGPPRAKADKIMVLDIGGPAPQPTQYVGLVIRRPDKRRSLTQSWRFTEDGRLCCAHNSMCVQAKDGFYGLQKGSEAVLGPPQPVTYQTTDTGLPLEQAVSRQRLRPGSGFLQVSVGTDGPTRVLKIIDIKEKKKIVATSEGGWTKLTSVSSRSKKEEINSTNQELQLSLDLPCLGVSLISRKPPEELIFAWLKDIKFNFLFSPSAEYFSMSVGNIQVDNQVFEAQSPVVLFVTPPSRSHSSDPEDAVRPAISLSAERTPTKQPYNAEIFKHLIVRIKSISLIIDERLLLKLLLFSGWNSSEGNENTDESDFETQRILAEATSVYSKRYYFESLKIVFTQVRLSVMTSNKLSERLLSVKKKLGLTLIRFEDAAVDLEPYCRKYSFESNQFLINSIMKHYKDELKWQAGIILGSVDFLGNPLGFVNDLSEGVSGLIYEGNVAALVKNVAHGISNSAAKVTESLGDGIGRVVFDDTHEERRQKIRAVTTGSSSDHLMAGLKGLGFGLLGGVTSVVKQTYEGYTNDGLQGTISGLAKGIVGTVTKPVVGVLDFASETASAVRDSSRSSNKCAPRRRRSPRCVTSPTGFLPPYNYKQSEGQEFLYSINNLNYSELFMAYEVLRSGQEDLRIVISSENIRVFSLNPSSKTLSIVLEKRLDDLFHCSPLTLMNNSDEMKHYVEMTMRADQGMSPGIMGHERIKRPRVRCDSEVIAAWVSQQVNYAKARFVERQHTLVSANDTLDE
uniref:Vacuolar protein sorting-associated protein 13D n=3 Tax=Lygus hesperus TaxID=30085 RepID=A0A0A9WG36_LYGHE